MNDWTAGYVADIGYTYGYHVELNPQRIRSHFLNAGLAPPTIKTACELGFGQGVSINMHAAASAIEWYGTDFNSTQAAFAQEMAAACGGRPSGSTISPLRSSAPGPTFRTSTSSACTASGAGFRTVTVATLVEFLRCKLKVGGVLYVGYNTLLRQTPS